MQMGENLFCNVFLVDIMLSSSSSIIYKILIVLFAFSQHFWAFFDQLTWRVESINNGGGSSEIVLIYIGRRITSSVSSLFFEFEFFNTDRWSSWTHRGQFFERGWVNWDVCADHYSYTIWKKRDQHDSYKDSRRNFLTQINKSSSMVAED